MWYKRMTLLLMGLLAASPAVGQEWARKMFKEFNYDFGTVARGAKAEHAFVLSNIYLEDVHITGVRSSCGCTIPRTETPLLKTYEKGAIIAKFNTPVFQGHRGATVTVTFDKPLYAEVQLHVSGNIRGDVMFQPDSLQLGLVDQGNPAQAKTTVTYVGRSDWKITQVKSSNPHLAGEVAETRRAGGQVSYDLLVHMDADTPPGYLNDYLMLVTNDREGSQLPVGVEGRVASPLTVSPSALFMGVVQAGDKVTKQLVVRGNKPFRILSITCNGGSFEFQTPTTDVPKPLYLIPITFVAGENSGKVTSTIRIQTDLETNTPELSAYAVVTKK